MSPRLVAGIFPAHPSTTKGRGGSPCKKVGEVGVSLQGHNERQGRRPLQVGAGAWSSAPFGPHNERQGRRPLQGPGARVGLAGGCPHNERQERRPLQAFPMGFPPRSHVTHNERQERRPLQGALAVLRALRERHNPQRKAGAKAPARAWSITFDFSRSLDVSYRAPLGSSTRQRSLCWNLRVTPGRASCERCLGQRLLRAHHRAGLQHAGSLQ